MYADHVTGSMERAMRETERRRAKQLAYNEANGITPQTIRKNIGDILQSVYERDHVTPSIEGPPKVGANLAAHLEALRKQMIKAAENLEFEEAARLRDEIKRLEAVELAVADDPLARQSAVEEAAEAAVKASGRSTAGKAGTTVVRGKAKRKMR
jgi:excinuclease ABC subunit B